MYEETFPDTSCIILTYISAENQRARIPDIWIQSDEIEMKNHGSNGRDDSPKPECAVGDANPNPSVGDDNPNDDQSGTITRIPVSGTITRIPSRGR
jgi:hypothetical protein